MRFVDLNNDILGMIGHKVFLRKLIQHRENIIRDKYCIEDLDRELKRDGYCFDNTLIMPFYSSTTCLGLVLSLSFVVIYTCVWISTSRPRRDSLGVSY